MQSIKRLSGICAALGILVLILDGPTALNGAQEGIGLCIRTVIPSLFPFFLLSIALTGALSGIEISVLRPLGKLCRIPSGSEAILLTGFLGGYPVGAQAVNAAYASGRLSESQANRMLSFCSNAGPSFLFGMIASQFPDMRYPWLLWGIHIISAILVAVVTPGSTSAAIQATPSAELALTDMMKKALAVMANVCGWVIIFRVFIGFLDKWCLWLLPEEGTVMLCGILELTNGCVRLQQVGHIGLRFLICAGMVSFGGICVTMQTASVIGKLSLNSYLSGKAMQTFFSLLLAFAAQPLLPAEARLPGYPILAALCVGILSVFLLFAVKKQNNSRNPLPIGV